MKRLLSFDSIGHHALNANGYFKFKYRQVYHRYVRGNARPWKVLILSSPGNSHGLCYPFHRYEKNLFEQFGLIFRESISNELADKQRLMERFEGDLVIFCPPLRNAAGKLMDQEEVAAFLRNLSRKDGQKLVLFDVADGPVGLHFRSAPFVDMYAMPYTFADTSDYGRCYRGGNNVADFISRHYGLDPTPANQYFPQLSESRLEPEHIPKLFTTHRIGFRRRMYTLYEKQRRVRPIPHSEREIDVHCRFRTYSGWCRVHRLHVKEVLLQLGAYHKVIASEEKVPFKQYCAEVNHAKIVVSPFGWGEFCPKDWEAFTMGALLVKPSVEHLNHFPRLFVPYETYVPVKWDLSDLNRTVAHYLENEAERFRIVANATKTVHDFYSGDDFEKLISAFMARLGFHHESKME